MRNPFQDLTEKLQGIEDLLKEIKNPIEIKEVEQLLSRDEVCELLQINKATLWKYTRAGKLKSYGISRRVYYKKSEVINSLTLIKK